MKQASEQQQRKRHEELDRVVRHYSRHPSLKIYHFSASDPSGRVSPDVTDGPVAESVTGFKRHHDSSVCNSFSGEWNTIRRLALPYPRIDDVVTFILFFLATSVLISNLRVKSFPRMSSMSVILW